MWTVGVEGPSSPSDVSAGKHAQRGVHLHPQSRAPDIQIPSAWGPREAASRPGTYSQNSMTGEVKFTGGAAALAAERFRKSTQPSAGDKRDVSSGPGGQRRPHTPSTHLWPRIPGPQSFLWSPRFPASGVPARVARVTSPRPCVPHTALVAVNLAAPLATLPATSDPVQTSGQSPTPTCGLHSPAMGGWARGTAPPGVVPTQAPSHPSVVTRRNLPLLCPLVCSQRLTVPGPGWAESPGPTAGS